ncbi:MAG: hypothetical protein U5J98_07890 [Halobacteriales archaeon]|nr:hypothetical protein [Halobacteriales archaeon]
MALPAEAGAWSGIANPDRRPTQPDRDPSPYGRLGLLVVACTAALTLAFVGVVSLATGDAGNVGGRVPFYVLGTALAFVGSILVVDGPRRDGRTVLAVAGAVAGVTFILLSLGAEGLRYAVVHPENVLVTSSGLYLVAAGLIGTGVGYWALRHWRELAHTVRSF